MGHLKFPPSLVRIDVLGEVRDHSGRTSVTRDIGVTGTLGPHTYQLYGDTFCHRPGRDGGGGGDFVGLVSNSYALLPDPAGEPARSEYLEGEVDGDGLVRPFIPYTASERAYMDDAGNREANRRVVCWCFGGIIEDEEPGSGRGWAFFDKLLTHGADVGPNFGMGVARVTLQEDRTIRVDRVMGDEMIFGKDDPGFGSTTHLIDDDGWVYLYGSLDPDKAALDMRMHIARIRRGADFTHRSNYEFWIHTLDGRGAWSSQYRDNSSLRKLWDLDVQLHGAVFKAPHFGPRGKPYVWVGVDKFMSKKFCVGVAPEVHGPWEVQDVGELPDYDREECGGPKYCLYPNVRVSDLARGELVCSWTDGTVLGGKVIVGRFWFEGDYERGPPPHPRAQHQQYRDSAGGDGKHGLGDMLKSKISDLLKH